MSIPAASPIAHEKWMRALEPIQSHEMRTAVVDLFAYARAFVAKHGTSPFDASRPRIVLVSRRLSCIYMMLVDAGFDALDEGGTAEVVFDRVLETSPEWGDAPVLLLDDVVIFGSTIAQHHVELRPFNVESRVAIVDTERADPTHLERVWGSRQGDERAYRCDAAAARAFAQDVAVALYRTQTPFFTDFPMTRKVDVAEDVPARLVAHSRWMAADVTLPISEEGQLAYTFIANDELVERIKARLHPVAAALAASLKVRVFFGPTRASRRAMRVVPIGIPKPVMASGNREVLRVLRGATKDGIEWDDWTTSAQHRLVQMYLSTGVLAEFWEDLGEGLGDEAFVLDADVLDPLHVRAYFETDGEVPVRAAFNTIVAGARRPEQVGAAVLEIAPRSRPFEHFDLRRELADCGWVGWVGKDDGQYAAPDCPEPGRLAAVNTLWAQRLLHFWSVIIEPFQEDVQERLRQLDSDAPERSEYETEYAWLRCGLTAVELTQSLFPWIDADDAWESGLLSLVLDIGNDLGIAVPSTHDEAKFAGGRTGVYRQYRAGENATVARSSVGQLAQSEDPSATFAAMDWMTRSAIGMDRGAEWGSLTEDERRRVRSVIEENAEVNAITARDAALVSARIGRVLDYDEERISVELLGLTYDGPPDYLDIDPDSFTEDDRSRLATGARVLWYVTGPGGVSGYTNRQYVLPSRAQ